MGHNLLYELCIFGTFLSFLEFYSELTEELHEGNRVSKRQARTKSSKVCV